MSEHVFLFKEKDSDDRDCVKYIEINRLGKLECGHYFPHINLSGACFSMSFHLDEIDLNNVISILTENDFERLEQYNQAIDNLGSKIVEGDTRYFQGIQLYNNIKPILDKLESKENQQLFEKVKQEEIEYLKEQYFLDDDEVDYIFENYNEDYRDRGIVGMVYNDVNKLAQEEAEEYGYVTKENERYFNYEKFGEDLLEEDRYVELLDDRIVVLNY